jgi:hypothetical protein
MFTTKEVGKFFTELYSNKFQPGFFGSIVVAGGKVLYSDTREFSKSFPNFTP